MKLTKRIKEQIKSQTVRKPKEMSNEFINLMGAYCLTEDLHMKTIYQLCKIKHIDQMLNTMYDTTMKEYQLHEPTINRLMEIDWWNTINKKLEAINLRLPIITR